MTGRQRLLTMMIWLLIPTSLLAKETDSGAELYQGSIATLVSNFMSIYHYEGLSLNDRMSRRILNNYLEALDYNRMFFLARDIEEFEAFSTTLDDDLRKNPAELDRAFIIDKRYRKRVDERIDYILKIIDKPFDFSKEESFDLERRGMPWAASRDALDDLWRKRIKEEIIRFKLQDREEKGYLELLTKRYQRLGKEINEEDVTDIVERYLTAVAKAFDPHSSYLKPMSKENFDIQMGHSLEGIGASLVREGEYTVVYELLEGGPAQQSGKVHPNDKIIGVAQGEEAFEDVVDMRLDKVVKQIRGAKGTKVRLQIIPADAIDPSETREVALIRDRVEITTLDAKAEVKEIENPSGQVTRLGVIDIPSFYLDSEAKIKDVANYKSTTRDVARLIKDLEGKHVDGLVIDLRRNGGGSLDEAIELTGLFIEEGPVVQIRNRHQEVTIERDPDRRQVYGGPLLVLTSVLSASASEIFAGAIQDYGRGLVVGGSSTHGKGTVQQVISLQPTLQRMLHRGFDEPVAGALKLTTHKFYRISGSSTQFKGVHPDIVLPSPYDGLDITEDHLDYALPWDEIKPAEFRNYGLVSDSLPLLKSNSAKRIQENAEFRYVREDLQDQRERRDKNAVTLNLAQRMEEKKKNEARDENREQERRLRITLVHEEAKDDSDATTADDTPSVAKDETPAIPDYLMEEALLILRDYVVILKSERLAVAGKKDAL